MIADAQRDELPERIDTDICIVGGGLAGIAMAREFLGQRLQVCILEGGGIMPDKQTQSLQWGKNVGHPYYSLDIARPRFLGGSANRWHLAVGSDCSAARMRPLDDIDFERRDWVPDSGWPFKGSELKSFYDRAQEVCRIGPGSYDVNDWAVGKDMSPLMFSGHIVETVIFKFGSRYPFIKDYLEQIREAPNVKAYIYANAVEIETDSSNSSVTGVRVATLKGTELKVKARVYILSSGAIEIARLLLNSNNQQKAGLGNQHDLVGRYFMEHPHCTVGYFVPRNEKVFSLLNLYSARRIVNGVPIIGKVKLSDRIVREEGLLSQVIELFPTVVLRASLYKYPVVDTKGVLALKQLKGGHGARRNAGKNIYHILGDLGNVSVATYRQVKGRVLGAFDRRRIKGCVLASMSEQVPNRDSRVVLSHDRDILGLNRVCLNWQLTFQDVESIVKTTRILDKEFQATGLGKVFHQLYQELPNRNIYGGWHHMGTTRMNVDPRKGVVNENGRVHSVPNLFIAGPSVFPTGGYANPALTIVALAIRLADYIKKEFR